MQVRPNTTVVRGKVAAIRPEADGWGAEVDLRVDQNESPNSEEDFLRPAEGSILKLFASEPDKIRVGDVVRAEAALSAGPTGERAVIRSVKKVSE
jgi:hypothetical protein